MNILDIIQDKRDGCELSEGQIRFAVEHYTSGRIPDYQMSALLMAIYIRGMSDVETATLTRAMLESGTRIQFDGLPRMPVDKHSTGGVGDKITLPLVPLVMAYGVPIPMLSGRGLGHSGGTLDKLESIPGFQVHLSVEQFKEQVKRVGAVIMGQTRDLAPADKKIYALRDVTATVPSIPLITASILCKKAAGGAQGLVLDVKTGQGAFMRTLDDARKLARSLQKVGTELGIRVCGYITSMSEPLGRYIGNALEVRETIDILRGKGPEDTTELTLVLGAEMLRMAGAADSIQDGRAKISEAIRDGRGLENFRKLIAAQKGNPAVVDDPDRLPTAKSIVEVPSPESGWIKRLDAQKIGLAAIALGAGREQIEDPVDHRVGVELLKKSGQRIQKGEPLARLHWSENSDLARAEKLFRDACRLDDFPPQPDPLIRERLPEGDN